MKKFFLLPFFLMTLVVSMAQNVGIGTSTPSARLEIRHTSSISSPTLSLYDSSALNYARLQFQNASGNKYWHMAGYIDDANDANSRLNFFHSATGDVLSLTGNGKVGIGTINPLEKLSVLTGNNSYGFSHSNGTIKLSSYINGTNAYFGTVSNHSLSFFTNDIVVPMTLTTGGNVGIGTANPQFVLDVVGRTKIRTGVIGNIFTTPGIWFDDYRDGSNRVFFGMMDSIRLGLWGEGTPGAGWAFNFNARNGTVSANEYSYTSPKTKIYSLGGIDFKPVNNTDNFQITPINGSVFMNSSTNPLVAPVHLPNGTVITTFIVYYYDNHASENLDVRLFQGFGSSLPNLVAQTISSGTPGDSFMLSGSVNHTVNNSAGFYFIVAGSSTGTWSGSSLRIDRIQINYSVTNPD